MKLSVFRGYAVIQTLAMLSLAQPSFAQQKTVPAAPTAAASQPAVQPPAAPAPQPVTAAQSVPAAAPDVTPPARSLKPEPAVLRELSPWSMFLSADVLVQAVMI